MAKLDPRAKEILIRNRYTSRGDDEICQSLPTYLYAYPIKIEKLRLQRDSAVLAF
jgi:hypothetical protein